MKMRQKKKLTCGLGDVVRLFCLFPNGAFVVVPVVALSLSVHVV